MAVIEDPSQANLAKVNSSGQLLTIDSARTRSGVYSGTTSLIALQATAQAANQGLFWLINPTGSNVKAGIRRVELDVMGMAVAAVITRLSLEKFTFTGTPSGSITPSVKMDSTYPNSSILAIGSAAGITVSGSTPIYNFLAMGIASVAGPIEPVPTTWQPQTEAGQLVLRSGEGLMVRQPDAGVTADPRRFVLNYVWEEFS